MPPGFFTERNSHDRVRREQPRVSDCLRGTRRLRSDASPTRAPEAPGRLWKFSDCPRCEDFLRHDPLWAVTVAEIPETHDEKKAREDFDKRGARDKDAILALALAKLAGIENLPDSLTRMVSGAPLHVPGQMECPSGHVQPSGMKFCGECGSPMHGSPARRGHREPQKAAGPPVADVDMPSSGRIKDAEQEVPASPVPRARPRRGRHQLRARRPVVERRRDDQRPREARATQWPPTERVSRRGGSCGRCGAQRHGKRRHVIGSAAMTDCVDLRHPDLP